MTPGARVAAAAEILDLVLRGDAAERVLTTWARQNRFAGSGDRAAIRDLVFDALRRLQSSAALGGGLTGRGVMIGLLRGQGVDPHDFFTGVGHAPAPLNAAETEPHKIETSSVALDCPEWLLPALEKSLGDDFAPVMEMLRERAPVFLRVNTARTVTSEATSALLRDGIETRTVALSATALEVITNPRKIQASAAYRDGLVELQDAASQAVADAVPVAPGQRILDFCAGGGGKSLALAARCPTAKIFAHDIDVRRMADLPARAARAGADIVMIDPQSIENMNDFDVVVVDAPCSGSGAWRRAPQGKWLLDRDRLDALETLQATILRQAAHHVRPGGVLAYMTCSLLESENTAQVTNFMNNSSDWCLQGEIRLTPLDGW